MSRNSLLAFLLSSIIGGVVTITLFIIFLPQITTPEERSIQNPISLTNYVFDSTDFVVQLTLQSSMRPGTPTFINQSSSFYLEKFNDDSFSGTNTINSVASSSGNVVQLSGSMSGDTVSTGLVYYVILNSGSWLIQNEL